MTSAWRSSSSGCLGAGFDQMFRLLCLGTWVTALISSLHTRVKAKPAVGQPQQSGDMHRSLFALFFFVQLEFYKANKRGCASISATQSVNKREKDLGVYKEVPGQSDIKKTDENKSKHQTQKQRRLVVTAKCFAVDTCEDDATGVLAVSLSVTQSISIVHRQMPSGGEKRGRGANPSSGVAGGTVAQC